MSEGAVTAEVSRAQPRGGSAHSVPPQRLDSINASLLTT